MREKIILDKNELYNLYCIKNLSQRKVASIFKCSIDSVRNNLRRYEIPSHVPNYHSHEQKIFLNKEQQDYIYGAMLGDGSLYKNKRCKNSQFIYLSKSFQHVNFVSKPFSEILYKEGIKYSTYTDRRTNKTYSRYAFRTITDIAFEKEREKWYQQGKKHIPNDLKLNSTICLIWYIGDGSICNAGSSQIIKLATQCFNKEEQEDILLPQLSDFNAYISKTDMNKNGEIQYVIYIPRIKMLEFLEYIGDCPFEDYLYKWNIKKYKNKVSEPQTKNEQYFIKLFLLGLSCKQIADVFDIDFNTVKKYLVKNNLYNRNE